jgi:hypothetical protein
MHLTVSCADSVQLADMICHVLRGDMRMLKKENVVQLISKLRSLQYSFLIPWIAFSSDSSLEWETFEQNCLWHLIGAHSISVESILPVLPKLEYHSKFITSFVLTDDR